MNRVHSCPQTIWSLLCNGASRIFSFGKIDKPTVKTDRINRKRKTKTKRRRKTKNRFL
uniref:Uncharacterized protein n=1 Tax=viral metagenome TaxID=1070528 RepID=A0A6C0DRR6_9ZZZZ